MSGVKKNSSDIDKWLKRPEVKSNDVNKSDNNNDDVEDDKNKWLLVTSAAAATSSMDVDSDGDDVDNDDDELTQWLLIGRSPSRKEPVKSDIASVSSKGSIEGLFNILEQVFKGLPGWIGGRRDNKKSANKGKPVADKDPRGLPAGYVIPRRDTESNQSAETGRGDVWKQRRKMRNFRPRPP